MIKTISLAVMGAMILLIAVSQRASAGPGLPDHWHGTPDPDLCNEFNDCIYIFTICYTGQSQTLGSHQDNPIQHSLLAQMIGAATGKCSLLQSERCKLLEVDNSIRLGISHPFTARWQGAIESLRFRSENGVVFISPLVDSIGFENGARTSLFSTADKSGNTQLAPGIYKVSCFGSSGTSGEEIRVTVVR